MNKIALVTGATAGIGKAVAEKLASLNFNLIITGRRNERLENLKKQLSSKYSVEILTLNFDIREKTEVFNQIESLPKNWRNIDLLVNNAGLASGLGTIQEGEIDDWERMIDTNIKGLLYMTRAISPLMIDQKKGQIINIGSIAGKEVYPNGAVYCSTKHAVDALNKGMRIDLLQHGIKVSAIHPGMVDTEFSTVRFHGDKEKADAVYQGLTPLYAEDIAEAVEFAVTRPAHVNINDMVIMPTAQATATVVVRN
jgi:NADP-dependent 3-hydroxy acid dehydrogenase YdfG